MIQFSLEEDLVILLMPATGSRATQQYPPEVVWALILALSFIEVLQLDQIAASMRMPVADQRH
jgi:hypothetical protein